MKSIIPPAAAVTACLVAIVATSAPPRASDPWQRLVEGNTRFVSGTPQHPRQTAERRAETAGGQKPFAVVVACSDSRTSPELLFDQGLGDLFVVRLAGNVP